MVTNSNPAEPFNPQLSDRIIRVFVSSTFRDMMLERDLLVKEVFPELRHKCAKRFVTFVEVDLRWGITEAQRNEGQVLPLCMAEIHRSRPYFIGLLGELYGSISDNIQLELIEREPWLNEHLEGRTSYTELEILHGVLNNPEMKSHAYFYFRDPQYVNSPVLTADQRKSMVEQDTEEDIARYGPNEAARRTEERKAKLAALKQRIRDSKLPLAGPYRNPEVLARVVRRQLNRLIDHLYPEDDVPDLLYRERMAHEAHAKNKIFASIERPVHISALNDFAAQPEYNGKGLVITGESGSGKTVLLAAWAREWANNHQQDFLFQHYFGATPDSASPESFLRRLLGELKNRFGIAGDIPLDAEKLRDTLPLWLGQTTGKGRVVLVLDGLNQVQGSEANIQLAFLPKHFQSHVAVLASALRGRALSTLLNRGWVKHDLPKADSEEVDAMIRKYLQIYGGRELEDDLQGKLVASKGALNPLFLRTILEELRQFGRSSLLPDRVDYYLEADNPKDLFLRVLARWKEDFDPKDSDKDGPVRNIVSQTLSSLWAARQGLSESEWLWMLGDKHKSQPLPRAYWAPLFYAMLPHLSQHSGLFAFGHDFLREAVETLFVHSDKLKKDSHILVADYFKNQPVSLRKAVELPWQLRKANEASELIDQLLDIPLFSAIFRYDKFELLSYWVWLGRERRMGVDYAECFEKWALTRDKTAEVANYATELYVFLNEASLYTEAEPLMERALDIDKNIYGEDHEKIAIHSNNLAILYKSTNRFKDAELFMERALKIFKNIFSETHLTTAFQLGNLGTLFIDTHKFNLAEPLLNDALKIYKRHYNNNHPEVAIRLGYLAVLYVATNRLEDAEKHLHWVLFIDKRNYAKDHPQIAVDLNNFGQLLQKTNRLLRAESCLRHALSINRKSYGSYHPAVAANLNNLAQLFVETNNLARAERMLKRALYINELNYGKKHTKVSVILNNAVNLYISANRFKEAEEVNRRALKIERETYGDNHPNVANCRYYQGVVSLELNKLANAQSQLRRALAIDEQNYGSNDPNVARDLTKLGSLFICTGQFAEAEDHLKRALQINEVCFGKGHPCVATCLNNLAELFNATKRFENAQSCMLRALRIDQKYYGKYHQTVTRDLINMAQLFKATGRVTSAELQYRRAISITERVYGKEHFKLTIILSNMADLLIDANRFKDAVPLLQRALKIEKKNYGSRGSNFASLYANFARLYMETGNYKAAEPLLIRVLKINEKNYGKNHPKVAETLNQLAQLFKTTKRVSDAERCIKRSLRINEGAYGDHPIVAIDLSNLAILLRNTSRPLKAEPLMRRALDIDERKQGMNHPVIPLQLNSLCTILIMLSKLNEANRLLAKAWKLKAGEHDLTSARILFVQLTRALIKNRPTSNYLGKLKTLLAEGRIPDNIGVEKNWDIASFIEFLSPVFSPGSKEFLIALADVLNNLHLLKMLDKYTIWKEQPLVPLD